MSGHRTGGPTDSPDSGVPDIWLLQRAAFDGTQGSMEHGAAAFVAASLPVDAVVVAVPGGSNLEAGIWTVGAGTCTRDGEAIFAFDSGHPVSEAYRTTTVVTAGDGVDRDVAVDVAVPVVGRDQTLGVVAVGFRRSGGVPQARLWEISSHIGLAWEHAGLQRRSRAALQETVTVLAAVIEGRDEYTESHCVHLAEMALAVGLRMGLERSALDRLTFGGILHDIGKIVVSDAILKKPGPLTRDEYADMKMHASVGEDILSRIGSLAQVAPVVGQHHERFDGKGYPRGLRGDSILIEARILAVVDTFDAMTTARPYRGALSWEHAQHEIRSAAGAQFDPHVVDAFLRYMEGEEAQWNT